MAEVDGSTLHTAHANATAAHRVRVRVRCRRPSASPAGSPRTPARRGTASAPAGRTDLQGDEVYELHVSTDI